MTTKHTPGPWTADGCSVYALDETGNVNRFSAHVQGGYVVDNPDVRPVKRTSPEELAANARLIAAAPDMLAAGRAMIDDYQTSTEHHPDHVLITRAAFEAMQAAITKTTTE